MSMAEAPAITPAQAPRGVTEQEELDPRRWIALLSVLTASFMVLLDISIVNVAIPAIRANLAASNADIQYVVAGYGLAYALMLITGGRLGDIYGRKRLFMIGMGGFVVASLLCGVAQTAFMLDISRVLQGLLAALMFPQVLSVIQVTFPGHERARAFGILGAVIGIATVTGPLVGGIIIRDDITGSAWRWIFLVNLPVGIVSLLAAARVLRESRAPRATQLDLPGVGIAGVGLFCIVFPLVQGQSLGWPGWTLALLGVSPIVLACFVLYERSLRADQFPLVQLSLFRIRSFTVGSLISASFLAGIPAFFFTLSLTLQVGLAFSALHAGLTVIPWSICAAVASAMSARIAPKLGKWTITAGSGVLALGCLGVILTLHIAGTGVSSFALLPSFAVSGLGMGTVIAPLLTVILAGVPPRDAGSASGVLATFQQIGGAIGVAVVGVIFFGLLSSQSSNATSAVTPALRQQLAAARLPGPAVDASVQRFTRCFHERAGSNDPTQPIPGCRFPSASTGDPAATAFSRAASGALARDFVASLERTLFFNAALWFLVAVQAMFLPRARISAPQH
jgi:EmrB/QacA subfamily drug resistance transporter